MGFLPLVSYMYAYSLYLFFDFAGYSAFAIGFSYLLGVHTPENFHRPFLAPNIREFWNRWHISLSWWFRDHVYSRIVFAALKGHWFKSKYTASYLGFFLAFGLMGVWHGVAWNFVLWGAWHGAGLLVQNRFSDWVKPRSSGWAGRPRLKSGVTALTTLATFHYVALGWVLFALPDPALSLRVLGKLFGGS